MPTTYAIPNGRTAMDATTYTGNGYPTSGTQTINNADLGTVGFKPDLLWIKSRSAAGAHSLTDSVRGTSSQLFPNLTNAQESNTDQVTAINSNGFSLGTNTTGTGSVNVNGVTTVAWQWQAGQGTTSNNTSGTISSVVSANTTAGFSIVTFTSNGSANASSTVGHGLGATPSFIIAKSRSVAGQFWVSYHASLGKDVTINLNSSNASTSISNYWGTTGVTSTVFGVQADGYANNNGNMVAYCWAAIPGFSAFGSYTGNGSADGPFVYLGFRPKFVLIKNTSTTGYWMLVDSTRGTYNIVGPELYSNVGDAEDTSDRLDLLSNGFKIRVTSAFINGNTNTMIYAAFAENPFKYANAR